MRKSLRWREYQNGESERCVQVRKNTKSAKTAQTCSRWFDRVCNSSCCGGSRIRGGTTVVVIRLEERRSKMMEKRNLDDLWDYDYPTNALKEEMGLSRMTHIRWQDGRHPCVVCVFRRVAPSEGFDTGNFAIDQKALQWAVGLQRHGIIDQAYVALVDKYSEGPVIAHDTVLNMVRSLQDIEPFYRPDESAYWWVDENLIPLGRRKNGPGHGAGRAVSKFPW